ncbi:MAG: recombinase family protein [Clostridia bacterium]|nr:recombinase family protein [Clostridia bacterium]
MIYGYARVSTAKQMKNGNSLQDQIEKLTVAGAESIFQDSYTGTKLDRPEFAKLMAQIKEGDTLIVTKLDRFARTATDGAALVQDLVNNGVEVNILNMGKADSSPMGKLMITIMFAFAEFERDMIVERTQEGKAVARANGKRVDGRPKKFNPSQLQHAMDLISNGNSYTETERMTGISKSTLIRERRRRKVVLLEG